MIGLDLPQIKTSMNLNMFRSNDDRVLLLFSIIILAHANTLILELGNYSFLEFLQHQKKVVLESLMRKDSRKLKKASSIINNFRFSMVPEQYSSKIDKLV
mmetsp:Transcript_28081/g.42472  ORF Transcript_28081/g.42472 Transcript_28081/m.42472 type:complete len:100 (-) Transcript_28081:160-459(-)